jgi:16S rRNA (cytosine967-C5)-methyltransferase
MAAAQARAAAALLALGSGQNLAAALATAARGPYGRAGDPALTQELVYGVTRWLGRLRALLSELAEGKRIEDALQALLCVALYQLVYTTAAQHTVVDQAVKAVKQMSLERAAGLVNALLRKFLRQRDALLVSADRNESARWSYPQWWIEKLRGQYPLAWEGMLLAGNQRPPLTLRVNRRQISRDGYRENLETAGLAARAVGEDGITLQRPQAVETLPGFAQGWFSVQDLGAQYAAPLLDCRDGMRVLDACAAPGGKSTHLLERNSIELTALDSDISRLARLDENLSRLGLHARVLCGDAAGPETWWDGRAFDRILADVPCSGSGVVRRHPDIKWLRRVTDLPELAASQRAIADALWPLLARGGKMLYATCSVFEEENEHAVTEFISRHSDACRIAFTLPGESRGQLLPAMPEAAQNHDGFYYALIQKT